MSLQQAAGWTRRRFLGGVTVAGAAGLLGLHARPVTAEPPPETTRLRLFNTPGICIAPPYVAKELLHAEQLTEVHYVADDPAKLTISAYQHLAAGAIDIGTFFVPPVILHVDAGAPSSA